MTVVRSIEEVEHLRPVWEEMQRSEPYPVINADIDQYISLVKTIGDNVRPHIILINQNGRPAAMLIGRVEKHRLKLKLGYKTLLKPSLRLLSVVYGGTIGQMTDQVCRELISELMAALTYHGVDAIHLNHLRTDSPLYFYARKMPRVLSRNYSPKVELHWTMRVPEEITSFYQARSKKHRANLRRYIRKLEKEYQNQTRVVTCRRQDELDLAIEAAASISRNTYQHASGTGFTDDVVTRSTLATAARLGWLRMSVLYIDSQPCAFQLGKVYRKSYFLEKIGFDPKWKEFNVGTILFLKVLENLCEDPQVELLNFGFSDAEYKSSYGNEHWDEASIYIFAPRFYPIFINILHTLAKGLTIMVRYTLEKLGFFARVKQRCLRL